MHLFWLVLLVPAVILSQWIWPVLRQRSIWSVGVFVAVAVIAIWLVMGIPTLGNQRSVEAIWKMIAFRIIAFTDLPLLQLLAACCVGWFRSFGVRTSHSRAQIENKIDEAVEANSNPYQPSRLS